MKKNFAAAVMLASMALGRASAAETEIHTAAGPRTGVQAFVRSSPDAVQAAAGPAVAPVDSQHRQCTTPGLIRHVAGGDPIANLRDAHKDPQRCKLSICIPASINLDVVCELTTAIDSEGRYNCRMVINDFLRLCTNSCHTGDWRWLDDYRGPY